MEKNVPKENVILCKWFFASFVYVKNKSRRFNCEIYVFYDKNINFFFKKF